MAAANVSIRLSGTCIRPVSVFPDDAQVNNRLPDDFPVLLNSETAELDSVLLRHLVQLAATADVRSEEPFVTEGLAALQLRPTSRLAVVTELDQARVQIAENQKAIDSLNRLLNELAGSTPATAAPHK